MDLATDEFSFGNIQDETRLTRECIRRILQSCGARMDDVVKCTVYPTDANDFHAMHEVYREFFLSTAPARTTIHAGMVYGRSCRRSAWRAFEPVPIMLFKVRGTGRIFLRGT